VAVPNEPFSLHLHIKQQWNPRQKRDILDLGASGLKREISSLARRRREGAK
jgi:hypothetical protein